MYLYLSPHLDDAVLSAGGLIKNQTRAGYPICIMTFCTSDPGAQVSELAKSVHARWGNPSAPFQQRRAEDIDACKALGAQWRHEGLLDAIYRREAEGGTGEYASFDELFDAIPAWDVRHTATVEQTITAVVSELRPEAIYAPLGVGHNVDHMHVVAALLQLQSELTQPLWFYEDQPYAAGIYPRGAIDPVGTAISAFRYELRAQVHSIDLSEKRNAILCYRSQLQELFGANLDGLQEVEAYSRSLSGEGSASERFWRAAA